MGHNRSGLVSLLRALPTPSQKRIGENSRLYSPRINGLKVTYILPYITRSSFFTPVPLCLPLPMSLPPSLSPSVSFHLLSLFPPLVSSSYIFCIFFFPFCLRFVIPFSSVQLHFLFITSLFVPLLYIVLPSSSFSSSSSSLLYSLASSSNAVTITLLPLTPYASTILLPLVLFFPPSIPFLVLHFLSSWSFA